MMKASSKSIDPIASRAFSKPTKKLLLWLAVVLYVFGTGLALFQPVHPDPSHQHSGWDKFLYPQENNAYLRLPTINANINDITSIGEQLWAVGNGGLILHSIDGGLCWSPQGPWVVSSGILSCPDQKTGLQRLFSGFTSSFNHEYLLNVLIPKAYAADAPGPTTRISDRELKKKLLEQEMNPQIQQSIAPVQNIAKQIPVELAPIEKGSAINNITQDVLLIERDRNQIPKLQAVLFWDTQQGIAVGDEGTLLRTTDGGTSWRFVNSRTNSSLYDIGLSKNGALIVIGDNGTILRSVDKGTSWNSVNSRSDSRLYDIAVTREGQFAIVGQSSFILVSEDNGTTWSSVNNGTTSKLYAIGTSSTDQFIAVGQNGTILRSTEQGYAWSELNSGTDTLLSAIDTSSNRQLFVAGKNGTILRSVDNGESWTTTDSGTNASLYSIDVSNKDRLIAVGENGTIVRSTNNGTSWISIGNNDLATPSSIENNSNGKINEYSVHVAGWWYLLTFVTASIILLTVWPRIENDADEGIAGLAASDKPLQPGDPDALNLSGIASDITSFLSNPKTTAPLTMAITGRWGSGKSSLMNLVQADLQQRGFSPVWFNAWHHQKGEQLLASLFAHIKQQAIPSWFSFDGLWFRFKLAVIRGRRHWFIFAIMLALLFLTLSLNKESINAVMMKLSLLADPKQWWTIPWSDWAPSIQGMLQSDDWIQTLASIFGIGTPLVALLRSIRGFGVSPNRLISIDHGHETKKGYDPGARARFAKEFEDVTKALGHSKMVIFIDDLDRCSQANLIDILENINFIASSGDCFMLLGMAPRYIEACVANHYETLAKSIAEKDKHDNSHHTDDLETHKFRFAHNYLEKMINIEVTIPQMQANSIDQLLNPNISKDAKTSWLSSFKASSRTLSKALNITIPILFIVLAIGYGWEYGRKIPDKPTPESLPIYDLWPADKESLIALSTAELSTQISQKLLTEENISLTDRKSTAPLSQFSIALKAGKKALAEGIKIGSLGQGNSKASVLLRLNPETGEIDSNAEPTSATEDRSNDKTAENNQHTPAEFRQAAFETDSRLSGLKMLLGLFIFTSFAFYLFHKKIDQYSEDSDDFKKSLTLWTPWIQLKQDTPRAIKRFLNHLRFMAIRNNRELNESILVAMATIYFYKPDWLLDEEKFKALCNRQLAQVLTDEYQLEKQPKDQHVQIKTAIADLSERLNKVLTSINLGDLIEHRERAITILNGTLPIIRPKSSSSQTESESEQRPMI